MRSSPITILHVDDQPGFLELTEAFLDQLEPALSYRGLETPAAVFEHLDGKGIDCIVSDYDMPDLDGITLLRELRGRGCDVPFVLFTGKGSEEVASKAISAGVTDYLQKGTHPSRFELLAHIVRTNVEQHRNRRLVEQVYEAMHLVEEGVGLVDEDGRFVYANRSYAEMFGYDPGELVGESWTELYRSETDASYIEREVMDELGADSPWNGKTLHERRDGSLFYVDHHLAVVESGFVVCRVKHDGEVSQVSEQAPPIVSD